MKFASFKLEEYLSKHEFSAPYLLCCSDSESFTVEEILELSGKEDKSFWNKMNLGYTETRGSAGLRETIASTLYPNLGGENILCFSGAQEGILASLNTLLTKEDHCIVITPCYQSLLEIPKSIGCEISQVELSEEHSWKIDINKIKATIKSNTKCLIINFPHNPTGSVINQSELDELLTLLDNHGIWLFSDEVYRLLGSPKEAWSKPVASCYERGISLGVMSKAYGLPGLRVGWVSCQNQEFLNALEKFKHYSSICNSAPSEFLSKIALQNQDKLLERNNQIVSKNLTLIENFIFRHKNLFSLVKPQGGCVGFVKYHGKYTADDFCEKLLKSKGVLLIPKSVYNINTNHFRIGFGRKDLPEALKKLEEFVVSEDL